MSTQKSNKLLMPSPPISNSARFRSPGIVRRNIMGDPGFQTAQLAKKSRRSKSSDGNNRDVSSNVLSGKRKLSKINDGGVEDHLDALNNRWRMMAKNHEKMTKDEIMNNYKLLLTDHIKLEKFMSLISRENELNRTRLESDLLDSMMLVEDLKQSLEARSITRRSRIDPRESEERRELITQNKKLLNELHELTKKNEKLEISIFDLKEQVELADFQMMEVQNQRIIMEEQLEVRRESNSTSSQTIGVSAEQKIETLTKERDTFRNNYNNVRTDYNQLMIDIKTMQDENEVLRISEENLQEELVIKTNEIKTLIKDIGLLEDRIKNSVDDNPHSVEQAHVNGPRSVEDETIMCGSDDFDDSSTASDSGFDLTDSLNHGDKDGDLVADTVKMLLIMVKDRDEEIVGLRNEVKGLNETGTFDNDRASIACNQGDSGLSNDRQNPEDGIGSCCSSFYKLQLLEKENRRWKSFVENIGKAENDLLQVIADLEESVHKNNQNKSVTQSSVDRSTEYFARCLEDIQFDHRDNQMAALLTDAEKVRDECKVQLLRLEGELDASNIYVERLDSELTTTKKIELTLRKRVETLEQRVMSLHNGSTGGSMKSILELETKIAQLETINSSLIEVNSLEKSRMEEQRARINELEHARKSLHEQLNVIQTKELFAQKKINRLQGVYEDLLREYATLRHPVNEKRKDSNDAILTASLEENKRLKAQFKELKEKYDELQTLIIRYQRHLLTEGKSSSNKLQTSFMSKSFTPQLRELGTK